MGVGYCALVSDNPCILSVRTATQQWGILPASTIPLRTHLLWNIDSNLRKVCCVLRLILLIVQIGLLCLEDVRGLARSARRRVPILDLTPMQIRARRVDLLDSASRQSVRD